MFPLRSLATTLLIGTILAAVSTLSWPSRADEPQANSGADAAIQQSIRDALSGKPQSSSPEEPLLQDVLDLIQGQGSILDGSALDEIAESDSPSSKGGNRGAECRAAEALLKAARLLNSLPGSDQSREALVDQMRDQAARCLNVSAK